MNFNNIKQQLRDKKVSQARQTILENPFNFINWQNLFDAQLEDDNIISNPFFNEFGEFLEECLALQRQDRWDELDQTLRLHNRCFGNQPWFKALSGLVCYQDGDFKQSFKLLELSIENEPSNNWFRFWACRSAFAMHDLLSFRKIGVLINNSRPELDVIIIMKIVSVSLTILSAPNCSDNTQHIFVIYKNILSNQIDKNLSVDPSQISFIAHKILKLAEQSELSIALEKECNILRYLLTLVGRGSASEL